MRYTEHQIEKLLVDVCRAINANNGQCGLIEDVLCRTSSLCTDLLDDFGMEESHELHRNAATDERLGDNP